jgi:hypothetical protein
MSSKLRHPEFCLIALDGSWGNGISCSSCHFQLLIMPDANILIFATFLEISIGTRGDEQSI